MFIRKKILDSGSTSIQLCESQRINGKVRQRILRHVGTAALKDTETLTKLIETAIFLKKELEDKKDKQALEKTPNLPIDIPEKPSPIPRLTKELKELFCHEEEHHWIDTAKLSEEARVVEGIHAIFGSVLDTFGLQNCLGLRQYDIFRHVIMARIAWPSSKLRSSENLSKHFNVDIPVQKIYRLMDELENAESRIQGILFNAFRPLIGEKVEVLFFDVTTLYFESENEDDLRRFGFSKDQKTHLTQVVLALATTKDGLPVGYKLFPGNTAETSTLLLAIKEWQKSLHIEKITIIADRAMMSEKNIQLLETSDLKYVIAAKLKLLPKENRDAILSRANETIIFQNEEDTIAVQEHLYQKRRLIVSHSTKRARKDGRDREQILKKLHKTIGKEGPTKKLVTNRGYLSVITESGNSKIKIDEDKVSAAAQWDGLHGVLTNIEGANHQEILSLYRRLWVIEESFRINKSTLEMRPIYHYISRRIKAHVLLCYITFALCRYVQKKISMRYEILSIDKIRSILIDIQYSVLKHKETECKYRLPSKMSLEARQIYEIFNLKRSRGITKIV